jgi:stage III sporulation protein AA
LTLIAEVQRKITDDIDALLEALPPRIVQPLHLLDSHDSLLEVVLDLGRRPEARFVNREVALSEEEVTQVDLDYVVAHIGEFGDDNRAGIERTLHRISAIRNRKGRIVGLTCRIGRAVYGTIAIIRDLIESGKSTLLLGRPGVGKTTMLREVARVLADDLGKRVIIVDTSNEIAGDGDIPHPAIGHARRMQVATPLAQHAVMIEAVENHMPEVVVIDEIGTELEAHAARTIAERGVQLVGTAHGNTLDNLMKNPTLADLIGGIQSVTLSDEEARRRGTQKSILERKAPPSFDIVVEIQGWHSVVVHPDVATTVDAILRGRIVVPEVRQIGEQGQVEVKAQPILPADAPEPEPRPQPGRAAPHGSASPARALRVYCYGASHSRLEAAAHEINLPVQVTRDLGTADVVITLKNYYRKKPEQIRDAEAAGVPVYVLKSNTVIQMGQALASIYGLDIPADPVEDALAETERALAQVRSQPEPVDLQPQNSYVRRLQHQLAEKHSVTSRSFGRDPHRRVRIYPG